MKQKNSVPNPSIKKTVEKHIEEFFEEYKKGKSMYKVIPLIRDTRGAYDLLELSYFKFEQKKSKNVIIHRGIIKYSIRTYPTKKGGDYSHKPIFIVSFEQDKQGTKWYRKKINMLDKTHPVFESKENPNVKKIETILDKHEIKLKEDYGLSHKTLETENLVLSSLQKLINTYDKKKSILEIFELLYKELRDITRVKIKKMTKEQRFYCSLKSILKKNALYGLGDYAEAIYLEKKHGVITIYEKYNQLQPVNVIKIIKEKTGLKLNVIGHILKGYEYFGASYIAFGLASIETRDVINIFNKYRKNNTFDISTSVKKTKEETGYALTVLARAFYAVGLINESFITKVIMIDNDYEISDFFFKTQETKFNSILFYKKLRTHLKYDIPIFNIVLALYSRAQTVRAEKNTENKFKNARAELTHAAEALIDHVKSKSSKIILRNMIHRKENIKIKNIQDIKTCIECESTNIVRDERHAEFFCKDCGLTFPDWGSMKSEREIKKDTGGGEYTTDT